MGKELILPGSYKSTILKVVLKWHRNKQTYQWNRIKSPEVDPNKFEELCMIKVLFQLNKVWKIYFTGGTCITDFPSGIKRLDLYLTQYIKLMSDEFTI